MVSTKMLSFGFETEYSKKAKPATKYCEDQASENNNIGNRTIDNFNNNLVDGTIAKKISERKKRF